MVSEVSTNVAVLTDDNFEQEVLKAQGLVLVDFWAPWCGPCKMFGPIIGEFADNNADKIKVGSVNVDEHEKYPVQFGVTTIPTLLIFKDGKEIAKSIGAISLEQLEELVAARIS